MNTTLNCLALTSLLLVLNVALWMIATSRGEPWVGWFSLASVHIFLVSIYWYLSSISSAARAGAVVPRSLPQWAHVGIALAVTALSVEAISNYALAVGSDPGYTQYGGDQIPKTFHAIRRVLNHRSMYEISTLPHTYAGTHLPGLTLSFLPAALLDMDIRYMGTLYYGLLLFGMCALVSSSVRSRETSLFLVPVIGFFTLPGLVRTFLPMAHTPPWWLALFGFCFAIHRGRYGIASTILAVMLFMRETAVVIAAFYALHLYRNFGFKVSAMHLGCVGLVNVLLWVPFFDAPGLLDAFQIKSSEPQRAWNHPTNRITVLNVIGFSNWFYLGGLEGWLRPALVLGILALLAHYLLTNESGPKRKFFFGCAAGMVWFLYLFGKPLIYEYIPLPILWVFGFLSAGRNEMQSPLAATDGVMTGLRAANVAPAVVLGSALLLSMVIPHYRNPVKFDFVDNREDVRGSIYGRERYDQGDFVWAGEGSISIDYPLKNIQLPEGLRMVFHFKLRPFTCQGQREQTLDVYSNGQYVARIGLRSGWRLYRVAVPTAYLRFGTNSLTLVPAFAMSPSGCGYPDHRTLSVAYDYVVIDEATAGEGESQPSPEVR
jgi:hypothetical protein